LGEGLTNEKNYWVHRSGHSAIWWNHNSYFWCVGVFAKLGSTFAGIVGPFHESNWPSTLTKGWKYSNTQDWKKAGPEDIKFEDWSLNEAQTPPIKLNLQLSGQAKKEQWKRAGLYDMQLSDINGIYNLGPKEINGYPHWIHENGKQAMWFNKISASWFVGDTEDVGDNMGGISGNNFVYISAVCLQFQL